MIIQLMLSTTTDLPVVSTLSGVCGLSHLGVIRVTGEDATSFLQGQLTQDVAQLGPDQARLAAFCNGKGRMQASFIVFRRRPDEILMVCSQDILPATLKRLSMFVLRAKARLSDATADYALFGLAGTATESLAGGAHAAWSKVDSDTASVVMLPSGNGQARALWCAPAGTPVPAGEALPLAHWQWLDVQSGIAMITQAIFEAFVPQMLNYESVGGVSFKKGCYPGQEIVARSQFRGTLKRRVYLAHTQGEPAIGQDVFHALDTEQPCGLVAACAPRPSGGFDALLSMQTSAAGDADGGRLTLGSAAGPALALLPLPYALLEDI